MITAVIPQYGLGEYTARCLRAMDDHGGGLCRVILVDNGSPDEEREKALEAVERIDMAVEIIRNETNLGHTAAINQGLERADGHALLLNNDCFITPGCIETLLGHVESGVGAVVPLTDGKGVASISRGSRPNRFAKLKTTHDLVELGEIVRKIAGRSEFSENKVIPFFCALLHRDALSSVGHLDPQFVDGLGSDDDWCHRARRAGWRVGIAAGAFAVHLWASTFSKMGVKRDVHEAHRKLRAKYR